MTDKNTRDVIAADIYAELSDTDKCLEEHDATAASEQIDRDNASQINGH